MLRLAARDHPVYSAGIGNAPAGRLPKGKSEASDMKPNKCLTSLEERAPKGMKWEWVSLPDRFGPLCGLSSNETRCLLGVSLAAVLGGRPF